MRFSKIMKYAVLVCMAAPSVAMAVGHDYGLSVLKTEAVSLQALLFGPVMRIAGVVGAVFGIIRSFQTQSLHPIFVFGGIAAATVLVPKLLEVFFTGTA